MGHPLLGAEKQKLNIHYVRVTNCYLPFPANAKCMEILCHRAQIGLICIYVSLIAIIVPNGGGVLAWYAFILATLKDSEFKTKKKFCDKTKNVVQYEYRNSRNQTRMKTFQSKLPDRTTRVKILRNPKEPKEP